MLFVTGGGTTIANELVWIIPWPSDGVVHNRADLTKPESEWIDTIPTDADRYLLAAGYLAGKGPDEISPEEARKTYDLNVRAPRAICERVLKANEKARICIIGSESAYGGSRDETYALSKELIHDYVRWRKLGPDQQLVAVAPSIIGDSGMTRRRVDRGNLSQKEKAHPKGRFLRAEEIARLVKFLLWEDGGYITGTVIRVHGRTEI